MELCKTCHKPKANYECGICHEHTCKNCTHFLGEDQFSFLKKVPENLTFPYYCNPCFEENVREPLEDYEATMEKAKEIIIFSKSQSKETSRYSRQAQPYSVEACEDEEEAILKMSFFAVQDNYNALIDIVLKPKKIIVGSHKKTIYSATAIPVNVDPKSLKDFY